MSRLRHGYAIICTPMHKRMRGMRTGAKRTLCLPSTPSGSQVRISCDRILGNASARTYAYLPRFICSSNNNIPRISQMVHKLCTHFSPLVHIEMYPPGSKQCLTLDKSEMHTVSDEKCALDYHPFPSPTQLEAPGVEMQLRALGFGYRAKYLARTAEMLCERARTALPMDAKPAEVDQGVYAYLYGLRNMSYYEARKQLLQLQGVGPKVADCVLLMSLDQHDSIPVDRHVFQFAERWYSIRSKRYEEVADRLRQVWGQHAGWAHSVGCIAHPGPVLRGLAFVCVVRAGECHQGGGPPGYCQGATCSCFAQGRERTGGHTGQDRVPRHGVLVESTWQETRTYPVGCRRPVAFLHLLPWRRCDSACWRCNSASPARAQEMHRRRVGHVHRSGRTRPVHGRRGGPSRACV